VDSNGYSADAGGLRLSSAAGHDATHYPLSLMVVPGDRLRLRLDYRGDLFDRPRIEALAERLVRLLEAAVAEPERAIGRLDILAPAERDTLLRVWNDTAHAVPSVTLAALFEAQVARSPDAIAVVFEDERLSYGELDARANQLAHHLRELGVGAEIVVGLCVERSLEMLIGLLGILKAGGAYLPLDPTYPQERLAFMLADAGAPVLVTQSALLDRLGAPAARIVRLDADAPAIARRSIIAPVIWLDPQNTAYVIYTSGSTGTPKGVVVEHAGLASKMLTLRDNFEVGSDFRSALYISSSFDASIEQTLLPFLGGGAAVVISDDVRESPSEFWQQLSRDRVTFMSCVPSYLESILQQAPETASLQHLALGGEALTLQFKNKVSRHLQVAQITNLYGPTEATVWTTFAECRDIENAGVVRAGRIEQDVRRSGLIHAGVRLHPSLPAILRDRSKIHRQLHGIP
jgi:amino acid adenylation domain-containing protein